MTRSLYGRLALFLLLLVGLLGFALMAVTQYTSEQYASEVTQRLNASIAMYVTQQEQLIVQGEVNEAAMAALAARAMTINPSVEVYLLDTNGRIIDHRLPAEAVQVQAVSLAPIAAFLEGRQALPIFGDDPRQPGEPRVFSVAPVSEGGETVGYLYAVLGGEKYQSLRQAVAESYILQMGAVTIAIAMLVALLAGLLVFFFLTRRLARLRRNVENFQATAPGTAVLESPPTTQRDEIDDLGAAFYDMSARIQQQVHALRSLDATRRELIGNVSHDLRTPLASMQGYIETLLIKDQQLDSATRCEYLGVALRHAERLNALIGELFELAKLDGGAVEPAMESFSLLELIHDCVQEFDWLAGEQGVTLEVATTLENCYVVADIALIQRVLQNLLDNAIRHTPAGKSVTISIDDEASHAVIVVADTGRGIARHEIAHIFNRLYQSQQDPPAQHIGAGLGLAIVKKILDLHHSTIAVNSEPETGTRFTFDLPLHTTWRLT